jgi:hypothetical protein
VKLELSGGTRVSAAAAWIGGSENVEWRRWGAEPRLK